MSATARSADPIGQGSWEINLQDHDKFPTLLDADGWQVGTQRLPSAGHQHVMAESPAGEECGTWSDRAKAASSLLEPPPRRRHEPMKRLATTRVRAHVAGVLPANFCFRGLASADTQEEPRLPPTDYEVKHHVGQQRARTRRRPQHHQSKAAS